MRDYQFSWETTGAAMDNGLFEDWFPTENMQILKPVMLVYSKSISMDQWWAKSWSPYVSTHEIVRIYIL